MRVIFHPEAHAEMIEQARYYENKSEGLGADFLDSVEDITHRIAQSLTLVRLNAATFASVWC